MLFGERYNAAILIAQIYAVSIPFVISSNIFEQYNIIHENGCFYQKSVYLKQILYLISLFCFTLLFKIVGILIAIIFRDIVNFFVQLLYISKRKKEHICQKI